MREEKKVLVCVSERLLVHHKNRIEWAAGRYSPDGPKLRHCHRKNEDGRKGPVFHQISKLIYSCWFNSFRLKHSW